MTVNFNTVQRIRLSVSAMRLTAEAVARRLQEFGTDTFDLDEGLSVYEGKLEKRVDVTLHEATVDEAVTAWLILRGESYLQVDCGRVYLADGRDFCAKHLHNLESRAWGNADVFPGYDG